MTPASIAERLYWTLFTAWQMRGQSGLPYLPLPQLEAIQARRVRRIVAHAYATVPHYREAMDRLKLTPAAIRTAADLERLPMVSADDLALEPERFRSRGIRADRAVPILSSGTTGHRKQVLYDLGSVFGSLAAAQRRRDVVARLTGITRGAVVQEFLAPDSSASIILEAQRRNSFMPRSVRAQRHTCTYDIGFDEALEVINTNRPEIIHGYGAFLGALFRHAAASGVAVSRPRLIISHSESMPEADRELLEGHFGVPVISMYVAAESGFIACQCERRRAFHLDVDRVAVRVVDAQGRTVPPGDRGEIVVSNLTNRATVLLNYRLGDVGALGLGPCPCGRTLPTLVSLDGRADSTVHLANGRAVQAWDLIFELQQSPEAVQLQFRHEAPARVRLRAVLRPDADPGVFRTRALAATERAVGPGVAIEVEIVPAIAAESSGKVRSVVHCYDNHEAR